MKKVDFTGTVSHGTMRPQDLIPSFLEVLEEFEHPKAPAFREEWEKIEKEEDWWGESCGYLLNEDMFDAMNELAPEGYYFGSHPGDGSDYGYWEEEE